MTDPKSLQRAAKLVARRGRAYRHSNKKVRSVTVLIFTKSLTTTDLLERTFGGSHYKHRAGMYWIITKRSDVIAMMDHVRPFLEEGHGLQIALDLISS